MRESMFSNNMLTANGKGERFSDLKAELADARLLQRISTELIRENEISSLFQKLVQAAVTIMGSQYGTMQMLYPHPGTIGKLKLIAAVGFTPEAEKYWEWVYPDTGSSCSEVLQRGVRTVVPDFASAAFMQDKATLRIFLEGGIFAAQSTPLYSRNGKLLGMISTHWKYVHNPPERHLNLLDVLARQAADLIERTQYEEQLRQSEERLRALTTATNDVLFKMSPDWREMYQLDGRNFLSDTWTPITHWTEKYIFPGDVDLVKSHIQTAIETKTIFQLEHRVIKADGTIGWTSSRAVPILGSSGELLEWFGAATDITDKKHSWVKLEEKVEERTKELQRSNEDLLQFAHVASHDLKEPVRKIRTFGLKLREELNSHANENCREYTDKILESASRMKTMIEGVLNYSSLNAIEDNFELLDLNKIFADITNDLEVLIEQKGAVLSFDVFPNLEGIHVLVYQLFYNLINNSLKFSSPDRKPEIQITLEKGSDDSFLSIVVTDNGIGFDPEHSEMIFDTFTRLNPKSRYDGTGLGLSLVKKIVEKHNGTIKATGRADAGAEFLVTLPKKQFKKL